MDKTGRDKTHSLLKTKLGGFAVKWSEGKQKLNKAVSRIVEAERSAIRSVMGPEPAQEEQTGQDFDGLGKDRLAGFPEGHVKHAKRKKGIRHIEKLLDQISEFRDEIDNGHQIQNHLEREIIDSVSANKAPCRSAPQRKRTEEHLKGKSHRSCRVKTDMKESEMNFDVKTKKILQKLLLLGKKYECGSPANNTIESHHQFSFKMADGTTREIVVVLREEDIGVFCRPNPPQWFEGNHQVEDALKEIQGLLESPN